MSMRSHFKELFANKGIGPFAFVMVLLLTTMPAFAQGQPPSASDLVTKMQSKLNLTQDQVTAITPIVEKYTSKRQELRQSMEDGTADKDSMRSQMKQLKTDEDQELSQVLSSDQMSQWGSMQHGMHKHRSDGNSEGGGNSNEAPGSGE